MGLLFQAPNATLVLADGSRFAGQHFGAEKAAVGELVFHTGMSGYQEILSDPSYAQQMICFASPHVGNVGVNPEDMESERVWATGVVLHEAVRAPSNYRSQQHLQDFLTHQDVAGISGVDTRRLISHLRKTGTQTAVIALQGTSEAEIQQALSQFQNKPPALHDVSCQQPYSWRGSSWAHNRPIPHRHAPHVVVLDYGVKRNILRALVDRGCQVTVVPAYYGCEQIMALQPHAILLSNGPGDPRAYQAQIATLQKLLKHELPLLGICLGYQLLALAAGAQIFKLKFGHHGANHPIIRLSDQRVLISSQNHNYAVASESLPTALLPTYVSRFDGTLQGFRFAHKPIAGFQGHPEAGPGPAELGFVFDDFLKDIFRCQNATISIAS